MNNVEKNYSTIKKEVLAMIYVVDFFWHYLLGNSFTFFVNHQVVLYLVNKLVITCCIARWLLLLQEFDLKVVYKSSWVHFVLDQLFHISHGELVIGVKNQLFNAMLFIVGMDWYGPILEYLQKGYFNNNITKEKRSHNIVKLRPYTLYHGVLYKLGPDNVLRQCLSPTEVALRYLWNYMKDSSKDILVLTTPLKRY
jgi:hypothetical protein